MTQSVVATSGEISVLGCIAAWSLDTHQEYNRAEHDVYLEMNRMGYFVHKSTAQSTPDDLTALGVKITASLIYDRDGNRKYLTVSERKAFLQAAARRSPEVRTFCMALAYTGGRISEVLALTSLRIDFEAKVIVFESLKKRRRGAFRAVPVPPEFLSELDRVHALRSLQLRSNSAGERIWSWGRTTAWACVKNCMTEAGVHGEMATPKGLRHSFAVASLQSGVPINFVKKWLGHARLATTEIYADAVGNEECQIAARLWQTFK